MVIQPYTHNPFYWQYQGKPVLLLGGSIEDNLFQIDDLEEQLDLLASVGGNYIRCTMSSRDEGDVWAFLPDASGQYDLTQPNPAYWYKFRRLLTLAHERAIIVQIEIWDRFDFAREPWQDNPFNPKNNDQYTPETSGLLTTITTHPGQRENAFFRSVPALENNSVILPYQHQFIDWLLEISLEFPNVLYCIDNETNESPEWGKYWTGTIERKSREAGKQVYVTEMWDAWDLNDPQHNATFDHPQRYGFVDISQNNHNVGLVHWENIQSVRQRIKDSGYIRPMNMVKIYGANTGRYGTHRDAQERFWRSIFGGLASVRFHRPLSGLGLNEIAQAHIRAMRLLLDDLDWIHCEPHLELLSNRSQNEAYCFANPGTEYAIFFPDGGEVALELTETTIVLVRWLDIRQAEWHVSHYDEPKEGTTVTLKTPSIEGYWLALVQHMELKP